MTKPPARGRRRPSYGGTGEGRARRVDPLRIIRVSGFWDQEGEQGFWIEEIERSRRLNAEEIYLALICEIILRRFSDAADSPTPFIASLGLSLCLSVFYSNL